MATRAKRAKPEDIEAFVQRMDAYLQENPGTAAAVAARELKEKIPVKNYYQWKRNKQRHAQLTTEFSLDAIPPRTKSGPKPGSPSYKTVRSQAVETQMQVALDLLEMATRILRRNL